MIEMLHFFQKEVGEEPGSETAASAEDITLIPLEATISRTDATSPIHASPLLLSSEEHASHPGLDPACPSLPYFGSAAAVPA
jgi:hypothetical protein